MNKKPRKACSSRRIHFTSDSNIQMTQNNCMIWYNATLLSLMFWFSWLYDPYNHFELNILTEINNASIKYSLEIKTALENIRKVRKSQQREFLLEQLVKSTTPITKGMKKVCVLIHHHDKSLGSSTFQNRQCQRLILLGAFCSYIIPCPNKQLPLQ